MPFVPQTSSAAHTGISVISGRRLWTLVLTGLFSVSMGWLHPTFADTLQEIASPTTSVPTASEAGAGLVWQVHGGKTRVFLAGSVHLGASAVGTAWPAELEYAWTQSKRVYFEVNPRDLSRPAHAAAVRRAGTLPGGRNLWHTLPTTTAALLDRSVSSQLLRNQLSPMRPWMAALTLHEASLLTSGVSRDDGLEAVMFRRAQRDRKEVGGLVSPVEQIQALASLSSIEETAFLHSTLESLSSARKDLDAMTAAWRRGDGQWLEKKVTQSFAGQPDFYERFMSSRNRRWAEVIIGLAKADQPTLIVVGCLHLAGPDNVRQCLAQHGFKVTPVHLRRAEVSLTPEILPSTTPPVPASLQPSHSPPPAPLPPRVNFPPTLTQPDFPT